MVAILPDREVRSRRTRPALIDCDFHNELDSIKDLYPYLSQRWRTHLDTFGVRHPNSGYYPRFMDNREDARPPSGRRSGSEVAFMREHFLEPYNVSFGILNPLSPAPATLDLELGAALATAVNDWQVAEWLDQEPRLQEVQDRVRPHRPGVGVGEHQPRAGMADIDAGAVADIEGARHLQEAEGLAHGRGGDRKPLRQILHARQPVPRPHRVVPDQRQHPLPEMLGKRYRCFRALGDGNLHGEPGNSVSE